MEKKTGFWGYYNTKRKRSPAKEAELELACEVRVGGILGAR